MEKKIKQIGVKMSEIIFTRVEELAQKGYRSRGRQIVKIILEHPDFKDIRDKVLGKDK